MPYNIFIITTPIYTWYNFNGYFQLQFIAISVGVLPTGSNIIVRADVYNSNGLLTHDIFVGSFNVSLNALKSPFNPTGLTNPILINGAYPILYSANNNGEGGYIKFFVTQVGSTTPGGGLKAMILGNLISF